MRWTILLVMVVAISGCGRVHERECPTTSVPWTHPAMTGSDAGCRIGGCHVEGDAGIAVGLITIPGCAQ